MSSKADIWERVYLMIEFVRTPHERFEDFPNWPWKSSFAEDLPSYEAMRMAYLDEGPKDAQVFLCLHGQPTWGYLYRKMIPVFLDTGARVVVPDLFGFGQSDKPVNEAVFTFNFHRNSLMELIERLDLNRVTLVCQDWGGLLGLTIPQDMSERFERLLVMNTVLGLGGGATEGFEAWKTFHREDPDYDMAALMRRYAPNLSDAEAAAYAAPFPGSEFRAGVRRFPELVMTEPDMEGVDISKRAARWFGSQWRGESFMAVGMKDVLITPRLMERMREILCVSREPLLLPEAGHFVQESGDIVARAALTAWSD